MKVLLYLTLSNHNNTPAVLHGSEYEPVCMCVHIHIGLTPWLCEYVCLCCQCVGWKKPQKAFNECETPVKQVYLGQMGERPARRPAHSAAAIVRGLDNRC